MTWLCGCEGKNERKDGGWEGAQVSLHFCSFLYIVTSVYVHSHT